jgi:hypothetical protein
MVSAGDGRKAVLLPAIEGIETVAQQLAVVRRKAGIAADEFVTLQRFTAKSYKETTAGAKGAPRVGR